jgi:precorrin-6B methylase 2
MKAGNCAVKLFLCFFLSFVLFSSPGQAREQKEHDPWVGQEGKDVPWVPSEQVLVEVMLDMAAVTPEDYVIDLGSGDGRIVIAAAKRGARAHGIEYEGDMVEYSRRNAAREGVDDRATFARMDIFETDLSEATVVTMFLLPKLNLKLRPSILDLKPGTRVVSNTFDMEDWRPDQTVRLLENCVGYCIAHLWIVPAKVEGAWRLDQGELIIKQEFQVISGALESAGGKVPVKGKLRGNAITFEAEGVQYTGTVTGDSMKGFLGGNGSGRWSATRIGPMRTEERRGPP